MRMHARNVPPLVAAPLLAALSLAPLSPAPLRAQDPLLLEASATRRRDAGDPLFGGLALTSYRGPLGLRLGGAAHAPGAGGRVPSLDDVREWTADADIVVEPFRAIGVARALLLGFSPYAFAGLGARGTTFPDRRDTSWATASAGAGVHHRLLGPVTVGADARYRRALRSDSAVTLGTPRHWEYRVALGIGFGGGRRVMSSEGALDRATSATSCAGDCAPRAVERRWFAERTATRVLDAADAMVGRRHEDVGFVVAAFQAEGIRLPASLSRLIDAGAPVATSVGSLRPGDLVFFAGDRVIPDHVGIWAGNDRVVHASGGTVRYDVLGEGARGIWLAEHLVLARRLVTGEERRARVRRPW